MFSGMGFVRKPHADVVRSQHTVLGTQGLYHLPEVKAPGGIAMETEYQGTRTLIDIVHGKAVDLGEVGGKRVQILEKGRSDLHGKILTSQGPGAGS
jgi:hypothetical protein